MRKQRKMGHITIVGPSMDIVRARMESIIDGDSRDEISGIKSTRYPESSTKSSRTDWAVSSGNDISGSLSLSLSLSLSHTHTHTHTHTHRDWVFWY
jgi:hypothetical protein